MRNLDRNQTVMRARELRRKPTLPEGLLWQALRPRPNGIKFRRQHPIGWYIADFYCAAASLVIEVDGESHIMGDRPDRDIRRDQWLQAQGLHVVRFNAADVMNDLDAVVWSIIRTALSRLPLHHAAHGPPPQDFILGRN
jgi:very-short-patch-repair endonuclease